MTTKEPVRIIAEPLEFDVWLDREIELATERHQRRIKESAIHYERGYLDALRRVKQELEG